MAVISKKARLSALFILIALTSITALARDITPNFNEADLARMKIATDVINTCNKSAKNSEELQRCVYLAHGYPPENMPSLKPAPDFELALLSRYTAISNQRIEGSDQVDQSLLGEYDKSLIKKYSEALDDQMSAIADSLKILNNSKNNL